MAQVRSWRTEWIEAHRDLFHPLEAPPPALADRKANSSTTRRAMCVGIGHSRAPSTNCSNFVIEI